MAVAKLLKLRPKVDAAPSKRPSLPSLPTTAPPIRPPPPTARVVTAQVHRDASRVARVDPLANATVAWTNGN